MTGCAVGVLVLVIVGLGAVFFAERPHSQPGYSVSPVTPSPRVSVPPTPLSAPPSFEGAWRGTVTETATNGQKFTYPVTLTLDALDNGRYEARYSAQATVWIGGSQVALHVEEEFTGLESNGGVKLQGQRKTRTRLDTGVAERMTPDTCDFSLRGGRLVGRGGNVRDGYVDFSLSRR